MKKKPAARAADPKPCESCGHCPTCGNAPREVVKVVPVPMPYPVYPVAPAPPVYPRAWQRRPYIGTPVVYRTSVNAEPFGVLMNCN